MSKQMTKFGCSSMTAAFLLLLAGQAFAADPDDAPTPRRMPRTPVSREMLGGARTAAPPRNVNGPAAAIDTERLRIGDVEVRLFGIVPPQLSASFGPQARIALDRLTNGGDVACSIRDRDHDGRLLATCHNAKNQDIAEEMLKRGLAVTARGSLRTTDLSEPYLAAEEAAESQKLGLWSTATPSAATGTAQPPAAPAADQPQANKEEQAQKDGMLANLIASATNAVRGDMKEATAKADPDAKPELPPGYAAQANPSAIIPPAAKADVKPVAPVAAKTEKPAAPVLAAPILPATATATSAATPAKAPVVSSNAANDNTEIEKAAPPSFIERYQLLISGILMLFTALGIIIAVMAHRWLDRRDELRSIAAALRGELQAARAVCLGRLQTMAQEADERTASWPRIRVMVFQAYVGRIGRLGAELARQIASIYGQASDYSAYYNTTAAAGNENRFEPVSKQQALQTLVRHIEDVVPRLADIEQHGNLLAFGLKLGGKNPTITGPGPRPGSSLPYVRTLGGARTESAPAVIAHDQKASTTARQSTAAWLESDGEEEGHDIAAQSETTTGGNINAATEPQAETAAASHHMTAVGPESEDRAERSFEPAAPQHIIQNQSEKHDPYSVTETEKAATDPAVQAATTSATASTTALAPSYGASSALTATPLTSSALSSSPSAEATPAATTGQPAATAAAASNNVATAADAVTAEAAAIAAYPDTAATDADDLAAAETPAPASAPRPLWGALRKFATERLDRSRKQPSMEDLIPDYDTLSDEEIEAMAFAIDDAEDDMTVKKRGVG